MREKAQQFNWKRIGAYGVIYLVWGSTFLAIRIGVQEVPPLLFAAMRFGAAGAMLTVCALIQGSLPRTMREWRSLLFLGCLFFLVDYGLLFWAEQRVDSGLAAVMLATIPLFMAVFEATLLRTLQVTWRLILTLVVGLAGVAVLVLPKLPLAGETVDHAGALALLLAAMSWSFGTVVSKRLALPESKIASSGAQMLIGGLLLAVVSGVAGETRQFHLALVSGKVWFALGWLITAGSVLGFTAYLWLLRHDSPSRVGTYAYVNPVVAMILGALFDAERVGLRSLTGSALVLFSVIASILWRGTGTIVHSSDSRGAIGALSAVSEAGEK